MKKTVLSVVSVLCVVCLLFAFMDRSVYAERLYEAQVAEAESYQYTYELELLDFPGVYSRWGVGDNYFKNNATVTFCYGEKELQNDSVLMADRAVLTSVFPSGVFSFEDGTTIKWQITIFCNDVKIMEEKTVCPVSVDQENTVVYDLSATIPTPVEPVEYRYTYDLQITGYGSVDLNWGAFDNNILSRASVVFLHGEEELPEVSFVPADKAVLTVDAQENGNYSYLGVNFSYQLILTVYCNGVAIYEGITPDTLTFLDAYTCTFDLTGITVPPADPPAEETTAPEVPSQPEEPSSEATTAPEEPSQPEEPSSEATTVPEENSSEPQGEDSVKPSTFLEWLRDLLSKLAALFRRWFSFGN